MDASESIKRASFLCSSPDVASCPKDYLPEFAFIGRSNVGKSSLINMLCARKGIAKVSSTPGKTRLINHFLIDRSWYIVDLPGYGYAKISKVEKAKLQKMIYGYLEERRQMRCVFLLIDSRLEPQKIDIDFLSWLGEHEIPFFILFTKTDKLSHGELQRNLDRYKNRLLKQWEELPLFIPTSSVTKEGKEIVLGIISEIMDGRL